ncbi:MAG: hypothetical protein MSH49_08430 [[Eubacterium] saphenum]|nr:hypothetical protein [[Eubacterium] saphenum]
MLLYSDSRCRSFPAAPREALPKTLVHRETPPNQPLSLAVFVNRSAAAVAAVTSYH